METAQKTTRKSTKPSALQIARENAAIALADVLGKTVNGYTVTIDDENNEIVMAGEYNASVHLKIKENRGKWFNLGVSNRGWRISVKKYQVIFDIFEQWRAAEQENIRKWEAIQQQRQAERARQQSIVWKTLVGETYALKEILKEKFSARWLAGTRSWQVPSEFYEEAQKMVTEHTESLNKAKTEPSRFLAPVGKYSIGQIVGDKRVTGFSESWKFNGEHSAYGLDPWFDGDVCYVYYEQATDEEIAAAKTAEEQKQQAIQKEKRIKNTQQNIIRELRKTMQGTLMDGGFDLAKNVPDDAVTIINTGIKESPREYNGTRVLVTADRVYLQYKRDTVQTWDYAPEYHVFTVSAERNEAIDALIEQAMTL